MVSADNSTSNEYSTKFKYLLDTYRKPNGERYTFSDIEKGTRGVVKYMWCWKMDKGQIESPGQRNLNLLTEFLGVKPGFWDYSLEDWKVEEVETKRKQERTYQNADLIRTRSMELSANEQEIVLDLIDSLRRRGKLL